jgi:hypothetical protein
LIQRPRRKSDGAFIMKLVRPRRPLVAADHPRRAVSHRRRGIAAPYRRNELAPWSHIATAIAGLPVIRRRGIAARTIGRAPIIIVGAPLLV